MYGDDDYSNAKRLTVNDITKKYLNKEPIVALTAYTAITASTADRYCDVLLVGDSVGMVIYGYPTTIGVTLDMMINHGRAVVNNSRKSLIVIDMPFSSYEVSPEQAYRNAATIMEKTNCTAVKLEGGEHMAPTIEFLTKRGIPVMAHIGLTPQHINKFGGFKVRGKSETQAEQLKVDLRAVEQAGSFSVVVEAVVENLARELVELSNIPTIGIGASVACSGQILVTEDLLGVFEYSPKFVHRYSEFNRAMHNAIRQYAEEVRSRTFPYPDKIYQFKAKSK